MDNYQCHIFVDNKTSEVLTLQSKQTEWGEFREGPIAEIPRMSTTGAKVFKATGTKGAPSGVEGEVVYQIGDDPGQKLIIRFDVPTAFWKNNSVHCEVPDGFVFQLQGFNGGGSTESCTVVLSRANPR